MGGDRIIAQHRMPRLHQVMGAEDGQPGKHDERNGQHIDRGGSGSDGEQQGHREQDAQRVADVARRERQSQVRMEVPSRSQRGSEPAACSM